MFPLIRPGDACRFAPCDAADLRKGDVALYYAETGRLVAHRLIGTVEPFSSLSSVSSVSSVSSFSSNSPVGERAYLFQGDANVSRDPPVRADAILGRLVWVRRDGARPLSSDAFAMRLWRAALFTFPMLRRPLHRLARLARVSPGGTSGMPL
jgi:signal peptidase